MNKFRQIKWRPVITGTILQFLLGIFCIRFELGRKIFQCLGAKAAIFFGFAFIIIILIFFSKFQHKQNFFPNKLQVCKRRCNIYLWQGTCNEFTSFCFRSKSICCHSLLSCWTDFFLNPLSIHRFCRLYFSSVFSYRSCTFTVLCNG